jgi:hypothetical protein
MTVRPTLTELRYRVYGAPPTKNTTEPCRTCADTRGAVENGKGQCAVFCFIPRERARMYPMLRAIMMPEESIMPCWRPTHDGDPCGK